MLGILPQGHFNQRGNFNADIQQVGNQSADLSKRPFGGISCLGEDLLHSGGEPFLASLQFFVFILAISAPQPAASR